jgi:preprotein translocase subunit SecE
VARNRKRAKERRARRPEPVISARRERDDGAPNPIAHAAPDVELAEAQLAVGRDPELGASAEDQTEFEEAARNGELEAPEALDLGAGGAGGGGAGRGGAGVSGAGGGGEPAGRGPAPSGEQVARGPAAADEHAGLVSRLVAFLQGCWHELQRVQWPDRRQVMQATGVVIGFVIIAGIFLGVADTVSSQIVKLILK